MSLEKLQTLSDKELDILSGINVMGWIELAGRFYREKFNYTESGILVRSVTDWNPTSDMNDAMELLDGKEFTIMSNEEFKVQIFKPNDYGKTIFFVAGKSLPRTITIASIMAIE